MEKLIEKFARNKSLEIFKGEHGKEAKPEFWVCGDIKLTNSSKTKCSECGKICYYDKNLKKDFGKAKKICVVCAYFEHKEDMTSLEYDLIKQVLKSNGVI